METRSKLKRFLFVCGCLGWLSLPWVGSTPGYGAQNHRNVATEPVANFGWEADMRHLVRFTTTTTAANTVACVLSTGTVGNLQDSGTGTFSPTIASSTTVTYGGRGYTVVNVISAASAVSVDYGSVYISTTTSPRLTQGDWWSPDDPIIWQGPLCFMSPSTFTLTGWFWFQRPRLP